MPVEVDSISSSVLRDQVSNAILRSLSSGDLKPGDQVNEAEIARQAGISRGPVREAIQQLVGEEILVSHPHRGTFVTQWDDKDIEEVYSIRAVMESYGASLASQRMTPKEFDELEAIVSEMIQKAHEGDEPSVFELDLKFHLRTYEFSRHNLLCRLLDKLRRKIYFYVKMDADTTPSLVCYAENHSLLLEALHSEDPGYTEKVFREHILEVGSMLAERFRQQRLARKHSE
ncbi:MAG: GntR family transcriptional regulator [Chloroflexota bacterium]|nr:MAG: GntR family transcriptional regulator [Chloroflexota bacterium]